MPAHGHGTSVQPEVSETAPGVFVAAPLYLHMPGEWELLDVDVDVHVDDGHGR